MFKLFFLLRKIYFPIFHIMSCMPLNSAKIYKLFILNVDFDLRTKTITGFLAIQKYGKTFFLLLKITVKLNWASLAVIRCSVMSYELWTLFQTQITIHRWVYIFIYLWSVIFTLMVLNKYLLWLYFVFSGAPWC